MQFIVVPRGGIEIFLVWPVGCAPIFRVCVQREHGKPNWLLSVASPDVDSELSVFAGTAVPLLSSDMHSCSWDQGGVSAHMIFL